MCSFYCFCILCVLSSGFVFCIPSTVSVYNVFFILFLYPMCSLYYFQVFCVPSFVSFVFLLLFFLFCVFFLLFLYLMCSFACFCLLCSFYCFCTLFALSTVFVSYMSSILFLYLMCSLYCNCVFCVPSTVFVSFSLSLVASSPLSVIRFGSPLTFSELEPQLPHFQRKNLSSLGFSLIFVFCPFHCIFFATYLCIFLTTGRNQRRATLLFDLSLFSVLEDFSHIVLSDLDI